MGKLSRWAFLVFLLLSLLPGRASAAEEGTIKVGMTPNPLAVSIFAPDEVIKGSYFTVRAQIENRGDGKIKKAVATIHLDEEGLSLGKRKAEKRVGTIKPHKVRTVRWRVKAVETGNYMVLVSVSGKGAPGELTAQDSVVVTVNITPNPLVVSLFAPDEVIKDRHFSVSAEIQNRGDEKIKKAVATIHLDEEGLSLGKKKAETRVGTIPPHKVKTVRWRVKAIETGNYIVLVSVSGTGAPGELTAQDSVMVTVKERRRRFFDLFQGWYELFTGWRRG